jgi:small-conductance mechanosensitive channel
MSTSDPVWDEILSILSITAGSLLIYLLVFYFLKRWAKRKKRALPQLLQNYIYYPGLVFIVIITLLTGWPMIGSHMPPKLFDNLYHLLKVSGIASAGVVVIQLLTVLREILLDRYERRNPKGYVFRKAKTEFHLIQRVLNFLIIIGVISAILMTFKEVRQIGNTLLASAGLLGIIIGFAAQKSLGNLVAGIQIALAQPIRIDDSVVVEGKFGVITDITLTYVVVNVWDGKRLIVPINYFLEKTFENWTRVSSEIISSVKIYTDYTVPIDEIRAEFNRLIQGSPLWDKRTSGFQVTDATDKTIELRGIMSARNSGDGFDLACLVREKLIVYIREKYPDCLPKARILVDGLDKDMRQAT